MKDVKIALAHVKQFHPTICMVVFNKEGQWQFMDGNFNSPKFGDEIDISILEAAQDNVPTLPYVYQE